MNLQPVAIGLQNVPPGIRSSLTPLHYLSKVMYFSWHVRFPTNLRLLVAKVRGRIHQLCYEAVEPNQTIAQPKKHEAPQEATNK
jgi:hypothetical protein